MYPEPEFGDPRGVGPRHHARGKRCSSTVMRWCIVFMPRLSIMDIFYFRLPPFFSSTLKLQSPAKELVSIVG